MTAAAALAAGTVGTGIIAYASDATQLVNDLKNTELFKGTTNLLTAGVVVFEAITIGATLFFAVKNGIEWYVAGEQEKPAKRKQFIGGIGIGIVVACVPGVLVVIFSAFGVTASNPMETSEAIVNMTRMMLNA